MRPQRPATLVALLLLPATAAGGTLSVRLPAGHPPASAAVAVAADKSAEVVATVAGEVVTFAGLKHDARYDVRVTTRTGEVVQGVDLAWHGDEPAKPDAGPLTDEDRDEIRSIVRDVPAFENRREVLLLRGDRDRAVALVQLVRDAPFHAGAGGEITWRVELHYFKFQHGGWERVQQQNKLLRRERFKDRAAYDATVGKLRWVPELGGVRVGKVERKEIVVPTATAPRDQ